jgi:general secretion pathway protein D
MDSRKKLHWLAIGLMTVLLAGCLTNPNYEEGRALLAKGQLEEGMVKLEQAAREEPGNIEIRSALASQKLEVSQKLLNRADNARLAGQYAEAEADYRAALRVDPTNPRSIQGLEQTRLDKRHSAEAKEAEALLRKNDVAGAEQIVRTILAQDSGNREARRLIGLIDQQRAHSDRVPTGFKRALDKPMTLEFRDAALKSVFEVLARSSGVNFVFDKDVRSDAKVTIFVRNSSLDEVIRLILATQQLDRKFLNENSILIYPNNPVKAKDYQNLVVKNFYLANADVKQAQALIKSVVKTRDTFIDEKLNLLVIKDTPDAVRLAEQLIEGLDLAEPEVMLDVEVLEMSRSKLLELGLNFPDEVGYGLLTGDVTNSVTTATSTVNTTTFGGQVLQGKVNLRNHPGLTSFIANPAVTLKLLDTDGDGNILANPRIRVRNRQKAKIHIGSKLPVFTTTSTANVGVSASVTYLDVGLKLDVEPQVYLDDEVGIKVGLEVSSVTKEITGPQGSIAYEVGTRNADTSLRLKNGQTQVLAGLINDEERSSANRVPGLGEIPVLGRLFSSHRNSSSKTEIVLLITPRIIRNVARPDAAAPAISSGTEASIGTRPLTIKAAPNSLSVSGRPTGGGGQYGAPGESEAQHEPVPVEVPPPAMPQGQMPPQNMPVPPPPPPAPPPPAPPPTSSPLQQFQMTPPPTMSTTSGQSGGQ